MKPRFSASIVATLLVLWPIGGSAQDCPELAGSSPAGVTQSVVAQGSLAFMGNGALLQVIDLNVPASPVIVGTLEFDSNIWSLAVDQSRIYVRTAQSLHINDVITPSAPVELGALPRVSVKDGLGASGNTVCIVESTELVVVDVSDPALHVVAGSWSGAYPHDVDVIGQVAYVMAGGLRVYDLVDPSNRTQIALYAIAGESLDVQENLVFVAENRLTAIDVSDPTTPVFFGMVDLPAGSATTDAAVNGDLAFVSTQLGGFHVIDVSDPQNPVWTGTAPRPADRPNECWVAAAAIADHGLVATTDHGVRVIDAIDPANHLEIAVVDSPGWTTGGAYSAGILVTANHERGIRIIDIADPSNPVETNVLPDPRMLSPIGISGSVAYVGTSGPDIDFGIDVWDIGKPDDPVFMGARSGAGYVTDFAFSGEIVFSTR